VSSNFVNLVQAALRTVGVCPACGNRIVREAGVRVRGERYHRACALYTAGGTGRRDG
jgi:predicted RNA-binding Zn-ribbon protein involved in translation (DUF1610 family)